MKNNVINQINLESRVMECYSYFMDNYKTSNLDILEDKIKDLHKIMLKLTMTNMVNIIERVVEDGRKDYKGVNRQYNVNSIQTIDNKINLICHEVLGYDSVDKKFILDDFYSYIDFENVTRIF